MILQTTPADWVTLVQNLGFPVAIILIVGAAVGLFYSRKVWPAKQAEKQRERDFWEGQFKRQQDNYDTTLRQIGEAIQSTGRVNAQVEQRLVQLHAEQKDSLKEIITEIRSGRNPRR